ncbi:farnesol dehydrogenase-like [Sitophilus oryzae]|uniref:Farnesol dehydrogenase-like n=1 Tax=Sitophilus oryzae TaxID=7048 RepID=A0A6J2Y3V3_SITOR|nr:farnesol dehydrogenase-like [Sitophilus oryzae]
MVLSLERFVGKVAVVTGASAGIGKAIVEELVKNGIIVAGLARRTDRLHELSQALSKEKGKLHGFKCDMTKEAEIKSTIQEVIKKLGNIHILVNNAGLMQSTDLINGDTEKWKTTIDTNILGLLIATREVVQNMKANNIEGHIVHINSILGHTVADFPNVNVYGATKYAVTALAETLRLDLRREKLKIKVTSISPGYVKTEFQKVAGLGDIDLPIPAIYGPDVAEAVIYALSTAPHINVTELTVQAVGS